MINFDSVASGSKFFSFLIVVMVVAISANVEKVALISGAYVKPSNKLMKGGKPGKTPRRNLL